MKKAFLVNRIRPKVTESESGVFGNIWEVGMPDSLLLQGVKNLAIFRHALAHEFDYFVTTISSSYINTRNLENFLQDKPRTRYLGGRIERSDELEFQQGSFRVYSRDVVQFIVLNATKYKHWQIEDIAMGKLLKLGGYKDLEEIPNLTLDSVDSVEQLTSYDLEKIVSYRCKVLAGTIRSDHTVMQKLHQRLRGNV